MKPINQKSQTSSHCVGGYFWMTLKSNELFIVLTRGTPGNPLRTPPQGSGTSKTSFITIFYVCEGSVSHPGYLESLRSWRSWRSQEQVQWPQLNPSTLPQFYNHAEEASRQVRFEMLSNHKRHNQYGFCHFDKEWFKERHKNPNKESFTWRKPSKRHDIQQVDVSSEFESKALIAKLREHRTKVGVLLLLGLRILKH